MPGLDVGDAEEIVEKLPFFTKWQDRFTNLTTLRVDVQIGDEEGDGATATENGRCCIGKERLRRFAEWQRDVEFGVKADRVQVNVMVLFNDGGVDGEFWCYRHLDMLEELGRRAVRTV